MFFTQKTHSEVCECRRGQKRNSRNRMCAAEIESIRNCFCCVERVQDRSCGGLGFFFRAFGYTVVPSWMLSVSATKDLWQHRPWWRRGRSGGQALMKVLKIKLRSTSKKNGGLWLRLQIGRRSCRSSNSVLDGRIYRSLYWPVRLSTFNLNWYVPTWVFRTLLS